MPTLSIFYGIEIRMYWKDHPPPHFHVFYAGHLAVVDIRRVEIVEGILPRGAWSLVLLWTQEHQQELLEAFELCQKLIPPSKITPLP